MEECWVYAAPVLSCFEWPPLLPLSGRPCPTAASPSLSDGWWCNATLTFPSSRVDVEEEEDEHEDEREGCWRGEGSPFLAVPSLSRVFSALWWRVKWGC